jgi:hypothetical protein
MVPMRRNRAVASTSIASTQPQVRAEFPGADLGDDEADQLRIALGDEEKPAFGAARKALEHVAPIGRLADAGVGGVERHHPRIVVRRQWANAYGCVAPGGGTGRRLAAG